MDDKKQDSGIATPSSFYNSFVAVWCMIQDVLGGTRTMRLKGSLYLPQHPAEEDASYQLRLRVATFEPLFKTLINNLVGRAFDLPIEIKAEKEAGEAEDFEKWMEDVDLRGNDANSFAQEAFERLLEFGLVYLLVDFQESREGLTQAEEKQSALRPYVVAIAPQDVLRFRYSADDPRKLAEVVIKECVKVWVGNEEQEEKRLRVLTPGKYELYKEASTPSKTEWVKFREGPMTVGEIPVVAIYAQKDDCEPPLLEAAYLNIKYYQFESNHDNALTVAQFPILTATGLGEKDKIVIGPKKLLSSVNKEAKFSFLEHSGSAIAAGRTRLEDIRAAISVMGAKLLMRPSAGNTQKTATEDKSDDKQSMSVLRTIAYRFTDGFSAALAFFGKWVGKDIEPQASLKGAFQVDRLDPQEQTTLLTMKASGDITRDTLWFEMQRRGIISDEFNAEKEKELLATSGPELDPISTK